MKRKIWWPAVLLGAMSPLAFLPDSSAQNPAAPQVTEPTEAKESKITRRDSCMVIREFLERDGRRRPAGFCGEGEMDFAIALVPDPLETNLSLFFDRFVESITMGASDAGYYFDRYFYPWDPQLAREEPDLEKRRKMEKERLIRRNQAGVLLFRSIERLPLAIFLVGETPTSGIRTEAFLFAMRFAGRQREVRILGPSFSGSVDSLIAALGQEELNPRFRVVSGSATSNDALIPLHLRYDVEFTAMLHNFAYASKLALGYLTKRVRADQIVLLREGETQFARSGLGPKDPKDPKDLRPDDLRSIAFPRGLAHLRDAYAALPRAPKQKNEYPPPSVLPDFPLDLREGIWGRDKAPQLSKQTPASQFALLDQIARHMRETDVRYAGVVATSVVDTIFLIQFLSERLPSVRFFTFDSDQLYVKAAAEMPIGGTLNFTTFPSGLKFERSGSSRIFSSDTAFGVYAAAIMLFNKDETLASSIEETRKAFSVSVVGRTGLWPVETLPGASDQSLPWSWILVVAGASIGCGLFAAALLASNRRPVEPKDPLSSMFWVRAADGSSEGRAAHLFRLACAIWGLYLFISLPVGVTEDWKWPWRIAVILLLVLAWLSVLVKGQRHRRVYIESGILLLFLSIVALWLANQSAIASSAHRLMSLSSGVSPLLPVWFLLGGLAYGAYVELRRYFQVSERSVTLPEIGSRDLVKLLAEGVRQRLQTAPPPAAWLGLLPVVVYDPASIFLGVEPPLYDYLVRVLFYILLLAFLVSWVRVIRVWRKVRLLLEYLERHPVGEAISRLPQDKDLSPFAVVRFVNRSLFWEERAIQALSRANNAWTLRLPLEDANSKCKELIRSVSEGKWVSAEETGPLYEKLYHINSHVLDFLNERGWNNGDAAKAASEYIALFFVQFLKLVMAQIRSLLVFVTVAFVLLQLSLAVYPWQGARNGGLLMACVFVVAGAGVILVFMQTERDAILSRLSGSKPGELSSGFWLKLLSYGAIPLATILATYFPEVGRWLFVMIGPMLAGLN